MSVFKLALFGLCVNSICIVALILTPYEIVTVAAWVLVATNTVFYVISAGGAK